MSRFALVVVAIAAAAAPAQAETAYFTAIPDLPVATGLTEAENQLALFAASDDSGLVIATAHGPATADQVRNFYMASLSPLGWAYEPSLHETELMFLRGRERLMLSIAQHGAGASLSVRLIVRPASMNAD